MTYSETINYLYNSVPMFQKVGAAGYKEGLYNTHALDEHLGHPHRNFSTIHVAGTNGKGSTAHSLAAILQQEGLRVGLYTSPHIASFRERIRINGEMVSQEFVIDFVEKHRSFFEPLSPSFFELTTAMAFEYFSEQKVDIAVIEVGLGGRLDCTNIITPILSIITNISLDHTQFLGHTLAQIASEKAGIIKPCIDAVIGEYTEDTLPVFQKKAEECNSPLFLAENDDEIISWKQFDEGGITYYTQHFGTFTAELSGIYQIKNTATILCAVKRLMEKGIIKNTDSIAKGLACVSQTGIVGRWQKLSEKPLIICDTGHNTGGWEYLGSQIKAQPCHHCHIVFGMVDDKDLDTVLRLLPQDATFYFTQASTHRAIPAERVAERAALAGLEGTIYNNVKDAVAVAKAHATDDDFIFIGGSSYVVSDVFATSDGEEE